MSCDILKKKKKKNGAVKRFVCDSIKSFPPSLSAKKKDGDHTQLLATHTHRKRWTLQRWQKLSPPDFGSEMNKTCKIYKPDKGLFIKMLWNSRQTGLILKNPAVKKNVRVFTNTLVRSLQFGFWIRAPAVRTTTCCHDFYAKSAFTRFTPVLTRV